MELAKLHLEAAVFWYRKAFEEVPMSEVKDFSFFISEMAKYDGKLDSDTVQEASEPVKIFFSLFCIEF